ncbi:MAG: TMEM43 family protein [Acetobacteraceae bacterium]|nr:TMEM43 family protein [Acetobacteraceae bacterium]
MADDDASEPGGSWTATGSDSFTETEHRSWWDRLGGAFTGILFGLLLIPGSSFLLFWNEGRAVQTARSLAEGAGIVVSVEAGRVDPALDGRLVHAAGPITSAGTLRDAEFGVAAQGALRLIRTVEMYQWREETQSETRSRVGGGQETVTTYRYVRGWSSEPIDSANFRRPDGHQNPPMRFRSRETVASDARLGARAITSTQLSGFGPSQALPVTTVQGQRQQIVDGAVYLGADPASPRIGDMRVSFAVVPSGPGSVIGRQAGDGFEPYQTRAGDRLFLLRPGTHPASDMIRAAESENRVLTWVLRGVGAVLMFIGFLLILRPLVVFADVVPLFGSIIGAGTGIVAGLLTLLLAPLVIAVAWFWFRPLVAGIVLAAGVAGAVVMSRWAAARRAARAPVGRASAAAARPAAGPWVSR